MEPGPRRGRGRRLLEGQGDRDRARPRRCCDPGRGQDRRAVGGAADRHPRPPPDRYPGPRSRRCPAGWSGAPSAGPAVRVTAPLRTGRQRLARRGEGRGHVVARPARGSRARPSRSPPAHSASPTRFSSLSITTRSGDSATMAATSGFLVPPTVGTPGASQKRVTATGVTPQASSVSVTDGTRLDAPGAPSIHSRSSSSRLLGLELGVGDQAPPAQPVELLDLGGYRPARPGPDHPGCAGLAPGPVHLGGDRLLDPGRPGQIREHLLALTAGRLEQQVAGADHPLQETLVVADVGQGRQRDLPTAPRQHAGPPDEPAGGHHQAGGGPSDVAPEQPDRPPAPGRRLPTQSTHGGQRFDGAATAPAITATSTTTGPARYHQWGRTSMTTSSPSWSSRTRKRHRSHGRRRPDRLRRRRTADGWLDAGVCTGHTPGLERLPVAAPAGWFGGIIRQARNRSLIRQSGSPPHPAVSSGHPPARHTRFVSSLPCRVTPRSPIFRRPIRSRRRSAGRADPCPAGCGDLRGGPAVHAGVGRRRQDPGPDPPDRLPGRARARPSPRHMLALTFTRKAAGELQDRLRQLGLREQVSAGTFHALASAQLHRWWADRGQQPPALLERKARLLAPLASSRPAPGRGAGGRPRRAHRVGQGPPDPAGRIRGRRPGGRPAAPCRCRPQPSPACTPATRTRRCGGAWSTSTTCWPAAPMPSRPTPPSPRPSAGGGATCSWTNSRTSIRCSTVCSWPGSGSSTDLCVVGDPHQAVYGWNGADAGLLAQVPAALAFDRGAVPRRQPPLHPADRGRRGRGARRGRRPSALRRPATDRHPRCGSTRPRPRKRTASPPVSGPPAVGAAAGPRWPC